MRIYHIAYSVLPVLYHHSPFLFQRFDMSKSSKSAIWGSGIYLSDSPIGLGGWKSAGQKGYLYDVEFNGTTDKILDITMPLSENDTVRIAEILGRETVDSIPIISLEKKFGSVAESLKSMGYDIMVHMPAAQSSAKRHYLCVNINVLNILNVKNVE